MAHVPVLLPPIQGTPISSFFLSQSEVSRAVYSELTDLDDIFVVSWSQKPEENLLIQLFSPKCENLPQYEKFQPSAMLLRGEAPWKKQGQSKDQYLDSLKETAVVNLKSNYPAGQRPVYEETHAKQSLWVGAEWKGSVESGLYTLVIFDRSGGKGNFVVGLNEKEAWTPDLFRYAADLVPKINANLCSPTGFTGRLLLDDESK